MNVPSLGGSSSFVTFIDDYSKFVSVFMLKQKSEVPDKFIEFVRMAENHTGQSLKNMRSDNGGEYIGKEFIKYCKSLGVAKNLTIPYSPQQNGVAERMNRTLVEMARSMLYHAGLPLNMWAEALSLCCLFTYP